MKDFFSNMYCRRFGERLKISYLISSSFSEIKYKIKYPNFSFFIQLYYKYIVNYHVCY